MKKEQIQIGLFAQKYNYNDVVSPGKSMKKPIGYYLLSEPKKVLSRNNRANYVVLSAKFFLNDPDARVDLAWVPISFFNKIEGEFKTLPTNFWETIEELKLQIREGKSPKPPQ